MNLRSGIYNNESNINVILIDNKNPNYIYWNQLNYEKFLRN